MKHKIADLESALLDAAVAKAEGVDVEVWTGADGVTRCALGNRVVGLGYEPSSRWSDGGPIIARERISLDPNPDSDPAQPWIGAIGRNYFYSPNPLVAAMLAYVASKFGDEVDLP